MKGRRNFLRPRVGVYPRFQDDGVVVHEFLRHGDVRGTIRPTARHDRCEGLRHTLATVDQACLRPRFGGYRRFRTRVREYPRHVGMRRTARPMARHDRCEGLCKTLVTLDQAFLQPRFDGYPRFQEEGVAAVHEYPRLVVGRGTVQLMAGHDR